MQMSEASFPQIRGAVQLITSDEGRPHYGRVRKWSDEKRSMS